DNANYETPPAPGLRRGGRPGRGRHLGPEPPMAAIAADRTVLCALLAPQVALIDQGQLVAAFQAWTLDKARALADHLVGRGDLEAEDRAAVDALVARHLKRYGGDAEKSLAALPTGRSTRAKLAGLGDLQIDASLAH